MINKSKITIKDVAKKANVSIATVSYVINGVEKVTEDTKRKILKTIEELGYIPNLTARSLVKKESRLIGILIPLKESYKKTILTDNPFYQEFISGVEYKARENGYSTLIIGIDNEDECIEFLKSDTFAGVIVLGFISNEIYERLEEVEVPVVVLDNEKTDKPICFLNSEDEKGAFLAVEYLIKKGHKNIGLLSGSIEGSIVHKNRYNGYVRALEQNGLNPVKEYLFIEHLTYEGGAKAADMIVPYINKLTAVFSISDIMALGLIKGLYKKGIKVPDDISVIGFDDIKNSRYFIPELTTVRQGIFYKGEKAVDIILNNLNNPENQISELILPVEIIERESVNELD